MRKFIAGKLEFAAYFFFFLTFFAAVAFLCSKFLVFIDLGFEFFTTGIVFFVIALILEISENEHSNKL